MLQTTDMMKNYTLLLLLTLSLNALGQSFLTREATVSFDASSPLEDISAVSESASAVYDVSNGQLGVQVLMTSFQFKRALMQEHFNENYAESNKYPKSTFKGNFKNGRAIGQLTIHGVTKDVDVPCDLKMKDGMIELLTEFSVKMEDYQIEIPSAVKDKIDAEAKIEVNALLKPRN